MQLRRALRHPVLSSVPGVLGLAALAIMLLACVATIPWTFGEVASDGLPASAEQREANQSSPKYDWQVRQARHLPPFWAPSVLVPRDLGDDTISARTLATARFLASASIARTDGTVEAKSQPTREQDEAATPRYWMGTDLLGRSVLVRCLAGGGISLLIGVLAALIAIALGTLYGSVAGYVGGRVDAVMMRIVDVIFGLPSTLLVVLLGVAIGALLENWQLSRASSVREQRVAFVEQQFSGLSASQQAVPDARKSLETEAILKFGTGEIQPWITQSIAVVTLFVAIGGVSWLTMARVVRGQVLSLKAQPFMEAARAMGVGVRGQFLRHLLPNLVGPITVYATLTVPQAILQESFLSFLGIGVRAPLPSWGNLAADGLSELNTVKSNWWLLVFPCLLLAITLLSLNFLGEGLREALDPKRRRR
jgi:oligopeptide transport system permease protein